MFKLKNLFFILIALTLTGAGCNNFNVSQSQQQKIDELTKTVENLSNSLQNNASTPQSATSVVGDSTTVKIPTKKIGQQSLQKNTTSAVTAAVTEKPSITTSNDDSVCVSLLEEQKNKVEQTKIAYQTMESQSYTFENTMREKIYQMYNIDGLKQNKDQTIANYLDIRDKYIKGQIDRSTYVGAFSQMSTASSSLSGAESQLKTETEKAVAKFKERMSLAKQNYDNEQAKLVGLLLRCR